MKSINKLDRMTPQQIIQHRLVCLGYLNDDFSTTDLSGGSPSFDLSTQGVDVSAFASPPSTLDSSFGLTTTDNPSLSSASYNSLFSTGGAAMNTVSPNPTIYSTGSSGTVAEIGSVTSAIGQWGYSISGLLGAGSPLPPSQAAIGATPRPASGISSNGKLLLIGLVIVAAVLLVMDEE